MANLPTSPPSDKRKTFEALCWARAELWRIGSIPAEHGGDGWIGYAVDPLQAWAATHGLDADEAQRIMADAFGEVRRGGDDD